MRQRNRFLMMAFVAMFAISTPADAQFGLGKLARKARKAVGLQTNQDKYEEYREQQAKDEKERKRKNDSIQLAIKDITPTIPQPAAKGALNTIRWGKTPIGTWDPVKLEITFNQTYDEGEFAGQKVTYKLDPATGAWTSKNGTAKGQISNDGTIESPNLGTIKFDPKTNKVSMDGEVIGEVTMQKATCFGHEIGSYEGHVSPLLIAYTFHGALISKNQVVEWKEAQAKAAAEAAARAERERQERLAREEALKKEWSELNVEVMNGSSSTLGYVRANGTVENSSHSTIGYIKSNGTIENSSHSTIGYVRSNGTIENSSHSTIGYYRSGTIENSSHSTIGYYRSGTYENGSHSTIGRLRGTNNSTVIAGLFFFFHFKDKVVQSSSSSSDACALYRSGSQFGELRGNGAVYIGGSQRGELRSNGDIYVGGSCRGEIRSSGAIYKSGSQIGEVRSNGDVYERGSKIGEIRSNGAVYKGGSQIGEARNMRDPKKIAVIYFFGFF